LAGGDRFVLVRVICGPTGGGKSALAMKLAERHPIAIISADSRQVYRGFDIGTAKPASGERERVPHFGIDVADPSERYSAALWAEGARKWIAEATARELTPLIVGGSGLYIRALFEPLSAVPTLDPARRAELHDFLAARPMQDLRRWCELLDPSCAHLGKTQLIRAIETALLAGKRISDSHRAPTGEPLDEISPSYLNVDPGPALHGRIETRFDQMVSAGWLDEVRFLHRAVPADAPAWNAAGYDAMRAVASGHSDLATARARVIIETRQFAKRQRTWFRNQLAQAVVTRVDPESPGGDLLVERWWKEGEKAA
jgi:tRNA dimethylallyltransferase